MLNVKRAKELTGGLGSPSKMPGLSYGLPAADARWVPQMCADLGLPVPPSYGCPVGAKLAGIKGTVCYGCYADNRGMYKLSNPKGAQVRRLCSLWKYKDDPFIWEKAMAFLINRSWEAPTAKKGAVPYFRWHDSGDLLGRWHLSMICKVARKTPKIRHWLPTRETKLIAAFTVANIPKNLTIRISASRVDALPPFSVITHSDVPLYTSTVDRYAKPFGFPCPAPAQGNECGSCRECWHKRKRNVSYHYH